MHIIYGIYGLSAKSLPSRLERAARFLGNGMPDRIDLLAEDLPKQVVPFEVLPQFAYLRAPV